MKLKRGCTQKTYSFRVADESNDKLFVFIDNMNRRGQKDIAGNSSRFKLDDTDYGKRFELTNVYSHKNITLRGAKRAYPVTLYTNEHKLWTENQFDEFKKVIDDDFNHIYRAIDELKPKEVVFPKDGLLREKFSPHVTPKIFAYILKKELELLRYELKNV